MYITDFVCTYKKLKDEIDSDNLYRIQYLQAFDINDYNFKTINEKLEDLFFYFKNDKNGLEIMESLFKKKDKYYFLNFICDQTKDNKTNLEEFSNIFFILFCYDLFDLMHNCLNDLFNNGYISENNKELLINEIEK
jgi:hypothetical protein